MISYLDYSCTRSVKYPLNVIGHIILFCTILIITINVFHQQLVAFQPCDVCMDMGKISLIHIHSRDRNIEAVRFEITRKGICSFTFIIKGLP